MTKRRLILLYGMFLALITLVLGRCYLLAKNQGYASSAQGQAVTVLSLPSERGNFYDRNGMYLTGWEPQYYALCLPGESSYDRLFRSVDYSTQSLLYAKRNSSTPFLIEIQSDLSGLGLNVYTGQKRYLQQPVAEHLIGYLNGDGTGVSGLEYTLNDQLKGNGEHSTVQCVTTASGELMEDYQPVLMECENNEKDVVLTLDLSIQRACEGIADTSMEKGCILVLETETGQILSCVSYPDFDPDHVEESLSSQEGALVNRAVQQYNVGSVFKPVVAAAALKNQLDWFSWDCEGSVEVDGQTYRCAKEIAHGNVNLRTALEESCNCFFIQLGLKLGEDAILEAAEEFGFGQPVEEELLGDAAGNLPSAEDLQSSGELAVFSFGQGQLLATPLQVAGMMNTIANDGIYCKPTILKGITESDAEGLLENTAEEKPKRILTMSQAIYLQKMLADVVKEGIGKQAQPEMLEGAGKTGTAQTGRFDEDGNELMDYWFAGFYPAENPQYTIVVLQDETAEPAVSCGKIFAQICDALYFGEMVEQ